MAAQEKAKAAEAASKVAEAEFSKTKEQVKEEAAAAERQKSAEEAQAEIMAKLSGGIAKAAADAQKKAEEEAPPSFEVAEAGMKPPPFETAAANMKPPSFETAAAAMPPPTFDAVESNLKPPAAKAPAPPLSAPLAPPAPSAPTFDPLAEPAPAAPTKDTVDLDFIAQQAGVEKVMPPPSASNHAPAAPPSFEQFEARATGAASAPDIDESLFDLDELGNALSPDEKQKMIAEQRSIMAAIEKEAAMNKAAIAAAQAENFEQRSGAAAVRAVNDGPSARSSVGPSAAPAARAAAAASAAASSSSDVGPTVNIGEGQNVALHGQEKTKKAIADGTAILVQCLNCNNWMQVTESATLMFCPVCQVVSPVMKQDEVQTSEEARQLDMDHKLAMQLQSEINAEVQAEEQDRRQFQQKQEEEEGYVSSFLRMLKGEEATSTNTERLVSGSGTTARAHAHAHGGQEKSWFDTFGEYVSVGVTDGAAAPRIGEISVSRPPGMTSATTGAEIGRARGNEQRGLLASVNGGMSPQHSAMAGMGSARVAESKPLFSCVMDSVTSAAAAAADTVTHYATGEEEGSRREGLLSVTGAGRGESGGGSYHQI